MTPTRAIIAYLVFGLMLFSISGWLVWYVPRFAGLVFMALVFGLVVGRWWLREAIRAHREEEKKIASYLSYE